MRIPAPRLLKKLPIILSALCVVLLVLSFLQPVQGLIVHAGETLKGELLRRPEKWFSRIRSALFAGTVCFAALQLLAVLVRKAWKPMGDEGLDLSALFMSDANLLSVLLAAAVSVFLTFALRGKVGNMLFFALQTFVFCAVYFSSSFCLMHNRHLQGKHHTWVQLAVLGIVVLWLILNFIPSSAGALWHSSARMRFRYRMPIAIYLLFLAPASFAACMAIRTASLAKDKDWSGVFRLVASLAYTLLLSSFFYVPNIFGDDPYHINGWEGSVFEVLSLAPYDSDHLTALYGHYGIFYLIPMRLLHLVGIPYNVAIAALQFLVAAVMLLSVAYVLHRFIRNDAAFFIFLLAMGSFLQFLGRAYFQQEPHRMVFGALVSACLLWADQKGCLTRRRLVGLFLLGAASLLWNPETGLICMLAIAAWLFLSRADFSQEILTPGNVRALLVAVLSLPAELAAAMLVANVYNLLCGGSPIGLSDFMFPLMSVDGLMAMLEWPIIGVHSTAFSYFIIFTLAICWSLTAVILRSPDGREERKDGPTPTPQLYAAIAMIGMGFMAYYMAKCSRGFLNICYLQFIMVMAGLWSLLDVDGAGPHFPLVRAGRVVLVVLAVSLVMDNITLPEKFLLKRTGGWRTDKLNSFLEVLKQDLPEGTPGFGQDVPELYAYMDRDAKIRMTDWANLRFWKDSDSRPFEYASEQLKGYDFFFANVEDVHLVSEAAKFHKIAVYRIGGQGQEFAVYAREGKSLDLSPFKGEGTLASPYIIGNSADLLSLAQHVNAGLNYSGVYFRQTADIDISSVKNWTPIADGGPLSFNGNYDGGGHVIKGLRIRKTKLIIERGEDPALFGRLGGRVCNLGIDGGNVQGIDYAAAFASSGGTEAVIANCWNRADVHAFEGSAGIAVNFEGTAACCVNFGRISKEFSLYGELEGVCAHGDSVVWECRPMEAEDFDFSATDALLKEAEGRFDLGGMRLIPWGSRQRSR